MTTEAKKQAAIDLAIVVATWGLLQVVLSMLDRPMSGPSAYLTLAGFLLGTGINILVRERKANRP